MSGQNNVLDDDSFTETLLRPWSFVSDEDGRSSTTRTSAMDKTMSVSSETYVTPHWSRKSLGAWAQYSSTDREDPSPEEQYAVREGGWWNQQMLVDRSLRSMAALTAFFAIIMISLCCTYMSDFMNRSNLHSTSVGSTNPKSCRSVENTNLVCHKPFSTGCLILHYLAFVKFGLVFHLQ